MYYKYHKVNLRHAGSYIDSPDWIKKKKSNNKSKEWSDKYFQYAVTVGESYSYPERVSNIKPLNKYKSKGKNHPSEIYDWKKFEKNDSTIALNIF